MAAHAPQRQAHFREGPQFGGGVIADARNGLQPEGFERLRESPQARLVVAIRVGVGAADSADAVIDDDAVGRAKSDQRQRIRRRGESVCGQPEVPGYSSGEMTDRMRNRRMKSRMEFAVCSEAAGRAARLEHEYALAAPRQVRGTNQSVMACANDDGIVL